MKYRHEEVCCYVCGESRPKPEMTVETMGPHQLDEFVCPEH
jgi:hypothetical protein